MPDRSIVQPEKLATPPEVLEVQFESVAPLVPDLSASVTVWALAAPVATTTPLASWIATIGGVANAVPATAPDGC